jgi:hypothetical protein
VKFLKIKNFEKSHLGGFQSPKLGREKKKPKKFTNSYIWFSLCSQKNKKMIKERFGLFISGL